jgi:hypothetical protein
MSACAANFAVQVIDDLSLEFALPVVAPKLISAYLTFTDYASTDSVENILDDFANCSSTVTIAHVDQNVRVLITYITILIVVTILIVSFALYVPAFIPFLTVLLIIILYYALSIPYTPLSDRSCIANAETSLQHLERQDQIAVNTALCSY